MEHSITCPYCGAGEPTEPEQVLNDICMECGAEYTGAPCECEYLTVVKQIRCSGCGDLCGYATEGDYFGPDWLFCPACVRDKKIISSAEALGLKNENNALRAALREARYAYLGEHSDGIHDCVTPYDAALFGGEGVKP